MPLRRALVALALTLVLARCAPPAGVDAGANGDAGATGDDAGASADDDAGATVDAGASANDAGPTTNDAGAPGDAGAANDAGTTVDAGASANDAGVAGDAGANGDGGADVDAGATGDAGATTDAGAARDAGVDSGVVVDAGPLLTCDDPIANGLVLHLSGVNSPFDTTADAGSCVRDLSGRGHHACQDVVGSIPARVAWNGRQAFLFDGTDDHLVVPDADDLDHAEMTLVIVGATGNATAWESILMKTTFGAWDDGWGVSRDNANQALRAFVGGYADDDVIDGITYDAPFVATFVVGASTVTLDLGDGSPQSTAHLSAFAATAVPLLVGAAPSGVGPSYFHDGAIAELLLYDRALTANEVAQVHAIYATCFGL